VLEDQPVLKDNSTTSGADPKNVCWDGTKTFKNIKKYIPIIGHFGWVKKILKYFKEFNLRRNLSLVSRSFNPPLNLINA
jgi:ssDNA-specific exonuclease RecJ